MTTVFKIGDKVRIKDDDVKKKYFPDIYTITHISRHHFAQDLIFISSTNNKINNQLFAWRLEHLPRPPLQDDPEYKDLFI